MTFWDENYTISQTARLLGCSKQNISQCVFRGSIKKSMGPAGEKGIPKKWVDETIQLRNRDNDK